MNTTLIILILLVLEFWLVFGSLQVIDWLQAHVKECWAKYKKLFLPEPTNASAR